MTWSVWVAHGGEGGEQRGQHPQRPMTAEEAALMENNQRLARWVANRVAKRVVARQGTVRTHDTLFEDLLERGAVRPLPGS